MWTSSFKTIDPGPQPSPAYLLGLGFLKVGPRFYTVNIPQVILIHIKN